MGRIRALTAAGHNPSLPSLYTREARVAWPRWWGFASSYPLLPRAPPLFPPSRRGARNAPPFSSLSKHNFTLLFVGEVSVTEAGLWLPPSGRGALAVQQVRGLSHITLHNGGAVVCKNRKVRALFFVLQTRCFRWKWLRLCRSPHSPPKTQKGLP